MLCIDHNLLITKLSWYGVTTKPLNLIFSYIRNRTQSVRINNSYVLLSYNIKRVVSFDNVQITSSLSGKRLGITFDSEL